jgi:hypothetical protein
LSLLSFNLAVFVATVLVNHFSEVVLTIRVRLFGSITSNIGLHALSRPGRLGSRGPPAMDDASELSDDDKNGLEVSLTVEITS